jgi:hypothetical protein
MLVKTTQEWLGFSVEYRFELMRTQMEPILQKHAAQVSMRFFDIEFYSARVTDLWLWETDSHHAYELLVEDLRGGRRSGIGISPSSRFCRGWRMPMPRIMIRHRC